MSQILIHPKAIQQVEFAGQLKSSNDAIVANESMFVLAILKKIKEIRLKLPQGTANKGKLSRSKR